MKRISVKEARETTYIGEQIKVAGWVRTRRDSKAGFSFIEINDGSCFGTLQIICDSDVEGYEDNVKKLVTGCSIAVEGELKESPAKGQATEMQASAVRVYGMVDGDEYPIQKKGMSFEFLRTISHLRTRTNTFGAVTRVRNQICQSIHQFFHNDGFYYVHTPIITASDCEGAGEMFGVTTLDPADPPKTEQGAIDYTQDFFGKKTSLTVSGQLEAEIYACSLGKVYTFGPTFRAENSNTSRHLSEFWMIEPEMAFYELEDNMDLAESFIKTLVKDVLENCQEDMEFFDKRIEKGLLDRLNAVLENDFLRLSYTEAIEILKGCGEKFEFPVEWGSDLQSEHERYLTEKKFKKPVILYDYPKTIKPFYMRCNDDDKTVRAMDVLVPKVGEIIGGSQREERLDVLVDRMKQQDLELEEYSWYTDLRRFGTVPHSGFGLGLERAVQFITGMENIRDVIPFPRTPGHAEL